MSDTDKTTVGRFPWRVLTPNETAAAGVAAGLESEAEVRRIVAEKVSCREHFIAQYLDTTGARIQDTELVEETSPDGRRIIFWCRPRGSSN